MDNSALLVIDYIKGIAETGPCAEYLKLHPQIIDNTNKIIQMADKNNIPIIYVRLAFGDNYFGLPKHAPTKKRIQENKKFLFEGEDIEFISNIIMKKPATILNKKYGDPFFKSNLREKLTELNVTHLIFTGLSTDNAILYGANTAITFDFNVTVVTDACAAPNAQAHEYAISTMKGRTVNSLLTTKELIATYSPSTSR